MPLRLQVNGEEFVGTGRSKKQAKQTVAESALRSFVQFKNTSDFQQALGGAPTTFGDFTSDVRVSGHEFIDKSTADPFAEVGRLRWVCHSPLGFGEI